MNFAIEVPGEATPLTALELQRTLASTVAGSAPAAAVASIADLAAQRKSSSQQLQAWETDSSFYPLLQDLSLGRSSPDDVRLLATIVFKNGIDKYWRHTARNAIQPPQKALIRSRLLLPSSLSETNRALALQHALAVAKIVRIDYPDEWPGFFAAIVATIHEARTTNPDLLSGALLVLLRVVKELATARMRRSQTALHTVTPELVQLLGEIYTERTAFWLGCLEKGDGDATAVDLTMKHSLATLKILRRLVVSGYDHPHADPMIQGFWSLSQSQFDRFLSLIHHPAAFSDLIGKHLIQFTKLHIDMCEMHPASFPMLPNAIPLVIAYWGLVKDFSDVFEKSDGIKQTSTETPGSDPKHEGPLSERLALKGLLLLRKCVAIAYQPVQTFKYRSAEMKQLEKDAVVAIKTQLLTTELLMEIVQIIISKLFVFRKSDLDAWEEAPEDWEAQERNEGQAWEWAVRPCAERLLADLLTHYNALASPVTTYCELATKVDMDIVTKEAAYCAMGCAAAILHKTYDFDRFLAGTLVKDAQIQHPMAKLLRRRISILLSQWISIKVSDASRPIVYDIFRHLLNPDDKHNDEVVRITAARQLKVVADDFGFTPADFLPFLPDIFNLLINLIKEVEYDGTKLAILETIRVIISRMDQLVSSLFGDAIMTVLPDLWASTGPEEFMIKQSVLAITNALITSMRSDSQRYHSFIIPLLHEAVNPESPLHMYLMEESVELWHCLLVHTQPPLSSDLASLAAAAIPMLEYDSEVATQCLEILKAYVELAPEAVLSDQLRQPSVAGLARTITCSKSRDQVIIATRAVESIFRAAEEMGGGAQGVTVIVRDLNEMGLLRSIMASLHEAWGAAQTTGPNRKAAPISTLTQTDYFALLARIAMADPAVFTSMLEGLGNSTSSSSGGINAIWSWLAPLWFASFDSTAELERQKLSCLALTRLCELPAPLARELILPRLQDFLSMWTSVIAQLMDGLEDGASEAQQNAPSGGKPAPDALVWTETTLYQPGEYDTSLDARAYEFARRDPVHTISALDFVRARLQNLVGSAGGEQAFEAEWAINVDRDVLAGFQQLLGSAGN